VDSSEPALNFLGRMESMAKSQPEQVPLVCELLGRRGGVRLEIPQCFSTQSQVHSEGNYGASFRRSGPKPTLVANLRTNTTACKFIQA
jgi:hypothetical protein